jgi:quercetin dioxygenase-like cupin family protein
VDAVVLRPGEGESLFNGRIVLKSSFDQLTITESHFPDARDGAEPHFHRQHVDSFYVREGDMAVLVHDEEKLLDPGAFVSAPPEVVHGFRTTSRSVFLNLHTPDGGSPTTCGRATAVRRAASTASPRRRAAVRRRRKPVFWQARRGRAARGEPAGWATIKPARGARADRVRARARVRGAGPHSHDDHVDSFYVLDGEVDFLAGDEWMRLPVGSFVAAPKGVRHRVRKRDGQRARLLNIHAPSTGFHERLREMS